jgi:hypothetical protein
MRMIADGISIAKVKAFLNVSLSLDHMTVLKKGK